MPDSKQPVRQDMQTMDFLTPQQRWEAIADILSTIALRMIKQEQNPENFHETKDKY